MLLIFFKIVCLSGAMFLKLILQLPRELMKVQRVLKSIKKNFRLCILNIDYIHCLDREIRRNMLTHWDTLSVSLGLWVGKAAMGPVGQREVGTTGQSQARTEQLLKRGHLCAVSQYLQGFPFSGVRETKLQ